MIGSEIPIDPHVPPPKYAIIAFTSAEETGPSFSLGLPITLHRQVRYYTDVKRKFKWNSGVAIWLGWFARMPEALFVEDNRNCVPAIDLWSMAE